MGHKVGGVAGRPVLVVDRCATSLRRMESLCQQLARQLLGRDLCRACIHARPIYAPCMPYLSAAQLGAHPVRHAL